MLLLLGGCAGVMPAPLDESSQMELTRIQDYLNSLRTIRAEFEQVSGDGVSYGVVWMQRPGLLRLDYAPPSQTTLVASNGHLVMHDGTTDATTRTLLSNTPLAMLLAPQIVLQGPVTVRAFQQFPDSEALTLVQTANPGQGSLALTFQKRPLLLQEVLMVDARGDSTRLVLRGMKSGVAIPAGLFSLNSHPLA
jgi:outer membrane lipoprotein-sorting protein